MKRLQYLFKYLFIAIPSQLNQMIFDGLQTPLQPFGMWYDNQLTIEYKYELDRKASDMWSIRFTKALREAYYVYDDLSGLTPIPLKQAIDRTIAWQRSMQNVKAQTTLTSTFIKGD